MANEIDICKKHKWSQSSISYIYIYSNNYIYCGSQIIKKNHIISKNIWGFCSLVQIMHVWIKMDLDQGGSLPSLLKIPNANTPCTPTFIASPTFNMKHFQNSNPVIHCWFQVKGIMQQKVCLSCTSHYKTKQDASAKRKRKMCCLQCLQIAFGKNQRKRKKKKKEQKSASCGNFCQRWMKQNDWFFKQL